MATRPEYITVGRFGRPRGVSGEIYVTPATDDPDRFLELTDIYVVAEGIRRKLHLESVAVIGGRPVVKVEGIDSREEAVRLTNQSVEIPLASARALPEGSYYQFDLVGCRAVGTDGTDYGVIDEVMFYPANDVYRIRSDRFGDVLFPAVDRFIVRVDIEEKLVIIEPPDGLFTADEDED